MYVLIICIIQEEPEDGLKARNIMRKAGSTITIAWHDYKWSIQVYVYGLRRRL